jgi:hypothetical protein
MAVFRFDTAEGQICPKRREGNITGPRQRYPSAKKIWASTSEGKTFVSRRQVRSSKTESRGNDTKCKCRNGGDKWWLQAPSFLFIIFRVYNAFRYNNPMLHFNTAIQLQRISSHAHTIQIGWGRAAPACLEHFRGEFRSRSLQVFTTSHGAARSHDRLAPPSDQSSLSTSSQISSIKRRNVVSILSRAICRSSLSVGIRPALKTGS